jgi:hypothetical protein
LAKTVEDLPRNYGIRKDCGSGGRIIFRFARTGTWRATDHEDLLEGYITIAKADPTLEGECKGAYIVKSSDATKGWIHILYDIAIEWSTKNGNGLVACRFGVKEDAYKIWENYLMKRKEEVEAVQIEDCLQKVSKTWAETLKIEPSEAATSFIYKNKTIDIIDGLIQERKYREK